MTKYRYRLIPQHASSDKYGKCDICRKFVSDVYHQIEEKNYNVTEWTHAGCFDYFGHKECLETRQVREDNNDQINRYY